MLNWQGIYSQICWNPSPTSYQVILDSVYSFHHLPGPSRHLSLLPLCSGLPLCFLPYAEPLKESLIQTPWPREIQTNIGPLPWKLTCRPSRSIYRNIGFLFLKKWMLPSGLPVLIWKFSESRKSCCWFRKAQGNRTSSTVRPKLQFFPGAVPRDEYTVTGCSFKNRFQGSGGDGEGAGASFHFILLSFILCLLAAMSDA